MASYLGICTPCASERITGFPSYRSPPLLRNRDFCGRIKAVADNRGSLDHLQRSSLNQSQPKKRAAPVSSPGNQKLYSFTWHFWSVKLIQFLPPRTRKLHNGCETNAKFAEKGCNDQVIKSFLSFLCVQGYGIVFLLRGRCNRWWKPWKE